MPRYLQTRAQKDRYLGYQKIYITISPHFLDLTFTNTFIMYLITNWDYNLGIRIELRYVTFYFTFNYIFILHYLENKLQKQFQNFYDLDLR